MNTLNELNELKDDAHLDKNLDKSNRGDNRDGSTPRKAVTNDRLAINTAWLLLLLMFSIYFHPKIHVVLNYIRISIPLTFTVLI